MQQKVQRLEKRVGVIGKGYWGSKFIRALNSRGIETVVATGKTETDIDEFLLGDFESVFIMTPVPTHYNLVKKALFANKHVFCEKNFTETLIETTELLFLAACMGRRLMVDFIYSFNPALKNFVSSENNKLVMAQPPVLRDECVSSILGSHALSVINKQVDLSKYKVTKVATLDPTGMHYQFISFTLEGDSKYRVVLNVISSNEKQRYIEGKNSINLDYPDGIGLVIDKFLSGYENPDDILAVAKKLSEIQSLLA